MNPLARLTAPLIEAVCAVASIPLYAFVALANAPKVLRLFSTPLPTGDVIGAVGVAYLFGGPDAALAELLRATDEAFASTEGDAA